MDKLLHHEALHMTAFLAGCVDRELVEHKAIAERPEMLELASRASNALNDLYQALGAATAGMNMDTVDSKSDQRTVNNTMRHAYRVLTDEEKKAMQEIKDMGLAFHDRVAAIGGSREISIAKTKIEEAVMWAVKHITA